MRLIFGLAIARRAAARGKRDRLAERLLREADAIRDITGGEGRASRKNRVDCS